eukprot:365865-Chlamydomonas_euryale.AAC.7
MTPTANHLLLLLPQRRYVQAHCCSAHHLTRVTNAQNAQNAHNLPKMPTTCPKCPNCPKCPQLAHMHPWGVRIAPSPSTPATHIPSVPHYRPPTLYCSRPKAFRSNPFSFASTPSQPMKTHVASASPCVHVCTRIADRNVERGLLLEEAEGWVLREGMLTGRSGGWGGGSAVDEDKGIWGGEGGIGIRNVLHGCDCIGCMRRCGVYRHPTTHRSA